MDARSLIVSLFKHNYRQLLIDCGIGGTPALANTSDLTKSELADAEPTSSSPGAFSQHRVLIFCQMKQMLDIVENVLFKKHMPSVTYMRLDGSTDANKRHAVVQTFNSDPSIDCLLLTTHVGGLGLTLTGADTVIFVEHDWNPMKDLQAMDRAHRIGQKKVVNVYRLITKGTLEEKIMGYAKQCLVLICETHFFFASVCSASNSISQTLSLHNKTRVWHRWTQT
jgi:TATA-binding protein-associated factor